MIDSPRKRLLTSLFPQWELSQYPKQLTKAIAKVEHQEYIKKQLFKMEEIRNKEDAWDIIAGKQRAKGKGGGRLGLDQLPISELASLDNHNFIPEKKLPAMNLLDERRNEKVILNIPTFKESLAEIVNDIESIDWLPKSSISRISNIFILTFARRYDNVQKLMSPNLTVAENRLLTLKIVEHIRTIVREVFESLYKRFQFMNRVGLFDEESNSERISTMFRTIINRKLDNEEIMDFSIRNLRKNSRRYGFIRHEDRHMALSEVELTNSAQTRSRACCQTGSRYSS
jgi:hypothetical protein